MRRTLVFQILSITCDNASNNDTMVEHLATLVDNFPGAANQTRCFTHILNLVAKSVLRQFDVPKKADDGDSDELDDADKVLAALAQELELGSSDDDDADEDDDDDEGGDDHDGGDDEHDERDGMSAEDVAKLEEEVAPVRLMLTKVSYL